MGYLKSLFGIGLGLVLSLTNLNAQIGIFEKSEDIGNPKMKGSSSYDSVNQVYTLKGGGSNIWFNHDEFHFLYKKIKGDFCLTANFELIGNTDGNGHRKTGWMIRESNEHDAVSVNTCLHGDGLVVIQWRLYRGAYMRDPEEEIFFPKKYFGENIIQLERIGKQITMRIAKPGENLEDMGSIQLPNLKDEVLIGPYALAHDPDDIQEARIWNVRITSPVAPDWHPNRLIKLTSNQSLNLTHRIETLQISDGKRKLIYESSSRLSHAMFSTDGKKIIFKQDSLDFVTDLSGNKPIQKKNNWIQKPASDGSYNYYNDDTTGTNQIWRKSLDGKVNQQISFDNEHKWFPQISPDRKWLSYLAYESDVNPNEAESYKNVTIKLMPVGGGSAKTIGYIFGGKTTMNAYSWSPDSKSLVIITDGQGVK